ncbi:MAG: protein translocase subunit SecF [Leptospiraceae bacterium]|nr:protein translocase subunit SecF [Leptospiraceae bacterium]MCK6379773.1 protein translocase subunit SecF [Leptospiraceae bacterium]NUM41233.1 protein translocase subunit SecF [Leptospiraceae bacterium]
MINFSKIKFVSISLSIVCIIFGFAYTFLVHKGFAHSLDFNGGLRTVITFEKSITRSNLEKYFQDKDIEAVIILLDKDRNNFQIDVGLGAIPKIKELNLGFVSQPDLSKTSKEKEKKSIIPPTKAEIKDTGANKKLTSIDELIILLKRDFKLTDDDVLSADQVGAIVGGELTSTGITLLLSTLGIITVYLSFRFQFKFALAASVALVHDLLFTIAMIGFFQIKPSIPIIAALLTLLGYSINDTIVIFDRIRENAHGKLKESISSLINISINQTLSRTINTTVSTLISVVALIFGGAVELYDFAYVLTFGIIIGTYSSIFIASPLVEIYDTIASKRARL